MKQFIKKVFFFSFPLLLLLVLAEYRLNKIPNTYNYKRQCLEQQLDSIQILVLGSSRSVFGVDPSYFSYKGFNLGNVSQSIYYDTRLTLKYIDRMPKLKFVLINMSYTSLGTSLKDGIESWRAYYYLQFWGIDYPENTLLDLKRFSKVFLYTPLTALGYCIKGNKVNLLAGLNRNGFMLLDTLKSKQNITDSMGKARISLNENNYLESRVPETEKDLETLLIELKKRNIQPVFITPPTLSSFYSYTNPIIEHKNQEEILLLCKKYKCVYFNHFRDNRFVQKDFNDNDHLNFMGAAKFSKLLNVEILNR